MDVETGRHVLKSTLEALDVGVELSDVVLESFDPAFLLSEALATFFLTVADKLRKFVRQSLVLHVVDVGKGGADGGDDGGGEGSRV